MVYKESRNKGSGKPVYLAIAHNENESPSILGIYTSFRAAEVNVKMYSFSGPLKDIFVDYCIDKIFLNEPIHKGNPNSEVERVMYDKRGKRKEVILIHEKND